MDHIVYLDSKENELENLIKGNKSMIIRGAAEKKVPHGSVKRGDVLYFVNNNGEGQVESRGVVSSVYNSDMLTEEESFEMIIRNQDKLQLPDTQFEKLAGKQYLVLIGIYNVKMIDPFMIDDSRFSGMEDWFPVGKIEMISF